MVNYKAIGRRIKFYRKQANLRQSDLAEKLDVSVSYISQLECGTAEISLKRLDEIALIISSKIQYLVADIEETQRDFLNSEIIDRISDWGPASKLFLIDVIEAVEKADMKK